MSPRISSRPDLLLTLAGQDVKDSQKKVSGMRHLTIIPLIERKPEEKPLLPCCAPLKNAQISRPVFDQSFVIGRVAAANGDVPLISTTITPRDRLRDGLARWGWQRMNYKLDAGLYAVGKPDHGSAVLVSANYMYSFNRLRENLGGRNLWLLVLDTGGINVWCAAGKGTFGTAELTKRIEQSGLKDIVSHRRLIVPQLGAPGVAAHLVKRYSGFAVSYGPIRAVDVPGYLDSGQVVRPAMRRVTFNLRERLALIPVELVVALKATVIIAAAALLIAGLTGPVAFGSNLVRYGGWAALVLLVALLAGTVLAPILLPYLPGRSFSLKGAVLGLPVAILLLLVSSHPLSGWPDLLEAMSSIVVIMVLTSYLTMNFTGSSTYTSLSGVRKEMKWALPIQIGGAIVGVVIWVASLLVR